MLQFLFITGYSAHLLLHMLLCYYTTAIKNLSYLAVTTWNRKVFITFKHHLKTRLFTQFIHALPMLPTWWSRVMLGGTTQAKSRASTTMTQLSGFLGIDL